MLEKIAVNDSKNSKIAFLVLHYQNLYVTYKCVSYLKMLEDIDKHEIVIVDNASPNGSGKDLQTYFNHYKNINIFCSDKNVGFASGNNIGYVFAREKLKVDIIIAMNSDVYIIDRKFIISLLGIANENKEHFIIAPDIVNKNGFHQNPYMKELISTRDQKKILIKKQIGVILYGLPFISNLLIRRKSVQKFQPNQKIKEERTLINIVPHGACVVFLPNWLSKEKYAFVEGTFLFVEEELLYDYCITNGYTIIYCPNLIVNHMEDASQDAVNKTALEKKRNQIKLEIASRRLLIQKRRGKF